MGSVGIRENNSRLKLLRMMNVFACIAMIAVNVLAERLPINDVTSGQVSDSYDSLFTPAGITFAIWFVIYIGLAYFAVWQAIGGRADYAVEKIGINFAVSCALNMAWLILWHYDMIYLATAVIFALWLFLIDIKKSTSGENWAVRSVFSMYYAWITVATVASLFIVAGNLFENFAYGNFAQILACIALVAIGIAAYIRLVRSNDYAYALTIAWSVAGILIRQFSLTGTGLGRDYMAIIISAFISVSIVLAGMILKNRKKEMI
ncbi:MAG: TspO/MBR family protein [Bacillota bacterium]|nr:TspO/MBR family protein [Bacillota bacterium]